MFKTWYIFKKELKTYFISPIAYVVAGAFLVLSGLIFNALIQYRYALLSPAYGNMGVYLLFIVPFLTMRLLAEEKKRQTMALLFTSPISNTSIVVGKFLACYVFVALMLSVTLIYPWILSKFGPLDLGPVKSGFAGLVLLAGCYVGVGLFASSVCSEAVIAGVLGVGMILMLYLMEMAKSWFPDWLTPVVEYVSIYRPQQDLLQGLLNSKDIVFYVSFMILTVFASIRMLEANRWR
ncbi:MAG: ABC transporter permease subunit [Candidatus Riflebacteria bacterium]|nr:ABC transporter permease subunit [Candidatus Riflebacteria bacterium]